MAQAVRREQRRLGFKLQALRQERGLTQEAAAQAIGISDKQLRRIELAQTNATVVTNVSASESTGCQSGGVGCIAMRNIMMNGALVGKNDRPSARLDAGARITANEPM